MTYESYVIRRQKAIAKLAALLGRDYDQVEAAIIQYCKASPLTIVEVAERLYADASRGDDVTWIIPRRFRNSPEQESTP